MLAWSFLYLLSAGVTTVFLCFQLFSCAEDWVMNVLISVSEPESRGVLCVPMRVRTCSPMCHCVSSGAFRVEISSVSRGRRTLRTSHSFVVPTPSMCPRVMFL